MTDHDGGPATLPGLSALDYFAAQALPALITLLGNASDQALARAAYSQAEAMLAERDRITK